VLIVDDNEALLKLLKSATRTEAWQVFTATTAGQALALASRHRPHVGLVDYLLPDLDGVRLSKQLQSLDPSMAIILTSGSEVPSTDFQFIQKPFLVEDVLASIRAAVSGEASSSAAAGN
jgi:DNA-binding response OmpR family regulator